MRARTKQWVTTAALAVLLLAGCSDGDQSPAPKAAPATAGAPTTGAQDDQESPPAGLDELSDQLEEAAEQAGAEGFGALTCESVQATVLGGRSVGQGATAAGLREVLQGIVEGAERSSDSVKDADLDATMQQQCPEVRQDALKAAGVNRMEELLNR